eukprot:4987432-Prymnesium_polylepis.1
MRDNATTRRERNSTSQQTMKPTGVPSTAPAQKQKVSQPTAHAVNDSKQQNDRGLAQQIA